MTYSNIKQFFFKFDPENIHKIVEIGLRSSCIFPGGLSFVAKRCATNEPILYQNLFGKEFTNPVGIAGGFDKNGKVIAPLAALGFGFIEIGTITPKSQSGNPKPRLYRLVEEESIQNFMGMNNEGSQKVRSRMAKLYPFSLPLIANIAKNNNTPNTEAIKDYEFMLKNFCEICDMFVINVSCPNTNDLHELQEVTFVKNLLNLAKEITKKPIFLKISPDMTKEAALEICINAANEGVSGIIISNTSVDYSLTPNARTVGGLSGKVLTKKSRDMLKIIADELYGKTTIISCGGISDANEAYTRLKMGANLIQLFTGFIFQGPMVAKNINEGLIELLKKDGYKNIKEAIGIDVKKSLDA